MTLEHTAISTIGSELMDHELICNASYFTFTSGINAEELFNVITNRLAELEDSMILDGEQIEELTEKINLLPVKTDERLQCEYRIRGLQKLLQVQDGLEALMKMSLTESNQYKLADRLNKLEGALRQASYGHLKDELSKRLESTKVELSSLYVQENEQDIIAKLKSAKTSKELDVILCEMRIEKYVNLGKQLRLQAANEFFSLRKQFQSQQDVEKALTPIIEKMEIIKENLPQKEVKKKEKEYTDVLEYEHINKLIK